VTVWDSERDASEFYGAMTQRCRRSRKRARRSAASKDCDATLDTASNDEVVITSRVRVTKSDLRRVCARSRRARRRRLRDGARLERARFRPEAAAEALGVAARAAGDPSGEQEHAAHEGADRGRGKPSPSSCQGS
jgi:hypothetical protein